MHRKGISKQQNRTHFRLNGCFTTDLSAICLCNVSSSLADTHREIITAPHFLMSIFTSVFTSSGFFLFVWKVPVYEEQNERKKYIFIYINA
ncbi:hypothetical protein FKM82_025920 [Ascaphus truei]